MQGILVHILKNVVDKYFGNSNCSFLFYFNASFSFVFLPLGSMFLKLCRLYFVGSYTEIYH